MRKAPPARSAPPTGRDCRCACGSLIARLVEGAVELKCRRCKQITRVPLVGGGVGPQGPRSFTAGNSG